MKESYEEFIKGHTTFGGVIHESDFDTSMVGRHRNKSYIADRIARDLVFDRQCQRNCEFRKESVKYCA